MKIKLSIVALAAALFAGLPVASSSAYVGVSVSIAPPLIPVYQQPYCPGAGYLWTPGYWSYSDFGYYWVPGIWVRPPRIGYLWTPGYWGYRGNNYFFNDGYWGPTVGYYGGINYGFGYVGSGYYGGRWAGNTFRYNTAVTRVNRNVITNTYVDNSFSRAATKTRASFNGPGGVKVQPTAQQQAVPKSKRIAPTGEQRTVVEAAQKNPDLQAKNNQGKPKAEAVNEVRSKVNPAAAESGQSARNGKQARAEKQAGAANQARDEKPVRNEKANRSDAEQADGNSAFGQRQGDATTRTKGSQNNAYGKAQSAEARNSRPSAKAARDREAAPSQATQPKKAVSARPAKADRPRQAVQRTERAPQRPKAVMNRRPAQNANKGPAQSEQEQGKKKKRKKPDGQ